MELASFQPFSTSVELKLLIFTSYCITWMSQLHFDSTSTSFVVLRRNSVSLVRVLVPKIVLIFVPMAIDLGCRLYQWWFLQLGEGYIENKNRIKRKWLCAGPSFISVQVCRKGAGGQRGSMWVWPMVLM